MGNRIRKFVKHPNLSFVHKAASGVYSACLRPKSEVEDERRKEFILNVILSGIVLLMICLNGLVVYSMLLDGHNYQGIPLITVGAITLAFMGLYLLSRSGYYVLASYILIALFLLGAVYGAYRWGTDLPSSLLAYALLIVISSILISTRFGIVIGLIITVLTLILGYHQSGLHELPVGHWKNRTLLMGDAIEYTIILLFILGVSALSNREIEKSLTRARRSEGELKQERDFLEIKVEERTRELKRLQQEKISQMEKFVEFGKLASGFFHDLANPLTALSISIRQMKENSLENSADAQRHLEQAFAASQRMENFLVSAKKQLQDTEQNCEFEINETIAEVLQVLSYKARKERVALQFTTTEKVNYFGDPLKFYQVALNLTSNALESFENSPSETDRTVTVILEKSGSAIKLSVADNGPGINPEDKENIFHPFFTTKQSSGGLGLGLFRTQEIIQSSFDGTIEVESNSMGTKFIVTIPIPK